MPIKHKSKRIVVLLSGGLDSSTVGFIAAKSSLCKNNKVYSLTFNYGQRHKKELLSAAKIAKEIGSKEHLVVNVDLTRWGGSALTDKTLKVNLKRNLTNQSTPNTYVPARNTIFLSIALAYAEAINAQEIYIGVNSVDYSGYVDCRPSFIKKFQELIKVATAEGVSSNPIKIKAPLIKMKKSQIVSIGKKLKVPWDMTWSCYEGHKLACGLCDSCQFRLKGFMEAGIKDPLQYKQFPAFYKKWLKEKTSQVSGLTSA